MERVSLETALILDDSPRNYFIPIDSKRFYHYRDTGDLLLGPEGYISAYEEIFEWYRISLDMRDRCFILITNIEDISIYGFTKVEIVEKPLEEVLITETQIDLVEEYRKYEPIITDAFRNYFVMGQESRAEVNTLRG